MLYFFATYLGLEALIPPCLVLSCIKEDNNIYIHHWVEMVERKDVLSVMKILILVILGND